MTIRIDFSFPESGDRKDPVVLPAELASLVPSPGDMVTVRQGFFRAVERRHFQYTPEQVVVTVVCR